MKTIFLFLSLFTYLNAQDLFFLYDDSDNIISEVNNYEKNVKNKGGNLIDKTIFNKQIKLIKDEKYLDSLVFWISAAGGLKKSFDTVNVLYDFKGNDLMSVSDNGPLAIKDPLTKVNSLNFLGTNSLQNSSFNINPPFTLIITLRQDDPAANECIVSSYPQNDYLVSTDNKDELSIQVQKKLKAGSIDQQKKVIIIQFNGDSSKVYVNNELAVEGKLDLIPLQGLLFGSNNKNNPDYFTGYLYECGILNTIISDELSGKLYDMLK